MGILENMQMKKLLTVLLIFSFSAFSLVAQDHNEGAADSQHAEDEAGFDPGAFMLDHVMDSYEWHIMTVGDKHISVPLPIILYSKKSGLHVFMSSKFHHGHSSYKGFMIATDGDREGKIVPVDAHGNEMDGEELPLDFSITKTVTAMFVSLSLLLWIFLSVARKYRRNPNKAPKGLQSALEPIIVFVRDDIAIPSIGEKRYEKFMPFLLSVFFFILLNNLMGVIPIPPGGANVTGNIAITAVLAIATFLITAFSTNKHYWKHIFNAPGVPWWLKFPIPLMPFIELLGVFTKPLVLCIRLFANMLAGHFIVLSFIALIFIFGQINWIAGYGVSVISVLFYIFMTLLEFLVAFIQAYVFTLLSALYFGMAKEEGH